MQLWFCVASVLLMAVQQTSGLGILPLPSVQHILTCSVLPICCLHCFTCAASADQPQALSTAPPPTFRFLACLCMPAILHQSATQVYSTVSINSSSTNVCLADDVLDELLETTSLEAAPPAVVEPSTASTPVIDAPPSEEHSQQSMPSMHRQATAEGNVIAEAVDGVTGGTQPDDTAGAMDAHKTHVASGEIAGIHE